MGQVLFDGVVQTSYGQFDLIWDDGIGFDGDFEKFFAGQANGLVGAAHRDGVYLNLARYGGGSQMRIELCDAEPAMADDWADVVEVSSAIPTDSSPHWESWAGEQSGALDDLPPGSYRLRVGARGRDEGRDGEFADHLVDWYLLQLWPAPSAPDAVVRVSSEDARYWHRVVGGRR